MRISPRSFPPPTNPGAFSILLLGDLNYDKPAHHDLACLEKAPPALAHEVGLAPWTAVVLYRFRMVND